VRLTTWDPATVEATWRVVGQPGPLRAFYLRVRSRRGHGKAIAAAARKLAVLFWCMLSRGQDYAHQQPSLTAKKLRPLELAAEAEQQLAAQAQASYERPARDWQASEPKKKAGASVTLERA
jgi:transposase